jgi:MerR family transcriptional regulator, light-induced transcriptional regulator
MSVYTIKDLENLTGVKAHTIRIWEQRYNFLKPQRTDTNIRYYGNDELKSILNITLLNKFGFKISHIDRMNDDEIKDKLVSLSNQQALQERTINELIKMMVDFDVLGFEEILDTNIASKGIEKTINQIIFPFMEKVGILWLANQIAPAQEHIITSLIRQKLIVGIEFAKPTFVFNKTVLLFLPENEYHELGILFTNFMLKSRGIKTIYLGANVPVEDIEMVVKTFKPDYIYTHLTIFSSLVSFERFLTQISKKAGQVPIVISGRITQSYDKKTPQKISLKRSLPEMMEFINKIAL